MSDSVGKISLDLEIKSDINKQVGALSNLMAKNLKSSLETSTNAAFSGMKNNVNKGLSSINVGMKSTLAKMKDTIRNGVNSAFATVKDIKMPRMDFPKPINNFSNSVSAPAVATPRGPPQIDVEVIKTQIQSLESTLDNTNAKIDQQREKLIGLKEDYNNAFNQNKKNKLQEQILKTESSINKLIATSDKLGFKLADLDKKSSMGSVGKSATNNINKATKATNNLSKSTKNATKSLGGMRTGLAFTINQMFKWMIILPMIVKGITAMAKGLFNNLNTNEQFANSLAQIKSNLMIAFTPIYQAILPAINSLMSSLSIATQYIASFISAIFGKTFNQSKQATQGLIDAKEAMGAYGDSAKKTAKALGGLMGFDEINTLKTKDDTDSSGGAGSKVPTLVQPALDPSLVDSAMVKVVDRVKDIMKSIFTPFKQAWEQEGVATIESMKYGLYAVIGLIASIGESLLSVWSNGTGTIMLSVILQILQTIFGIIGDIGNTFAIAWETGNIGTQIIQSVANTIINLLTLIRNIGITLQEAWGIVGQSVADTFMGVVNATIGVLENLSAKLIYVWDNGGNHLFNGLIQLGAKVFELAGYIYTEFVTPLANWFINLVAPAFAVVLDAAGDLLDGLTSLIDWLLGDGKPVLDTIVIVVGSFAAAWGIVTLAAKAYSLAQVALSAILVVGTGITTVFGAAVAFLTSPFGIAIAIIGSIIAIGVLLYRNWDTIIVWAGKMGTAVMNVFANMGSFIGGVFKGIVNGFIWVINFCLKGVNAMIKGFLDPINGLIKGWNGSIGVVAGKIAPIQVSIPNVPYLAKGGILDSPTLAMVGEQGKEAVVPLENNTQGLDLLANKLLERMGGSTGNGNPEGNSSQPLQLILNLDGSKLAEVLIKNINKLNRSAGTNLIIG